MASGSRKPLSKFARFQYNIETSFVADALLDPILLQLPLHGLETDCIDPGVLAQIDPSKHSWKTFPREMLLLGYDMKEWMEEDGQAEKEIIPSSKRMKSDHSKIQFGTKVSPDEEIAKAICSQCHYIILAVSYIKYWHSGAFELVGYHATNIYRPALYAE